MLMRERSQQSKNLTKKCPAFYSFHHNMMYRIRAQQISFTNLNTMLSVQVPKPSPKMSLKNIKHYWRDIDHLILKILDQTNANTHY